MATVVVAADGAVVTMQRRTRRLLTLAHSRVITIHDTIPTRNKKPPTEAPTTSGVFTVERRVMDTQNKSEFMTLV